MFEITTLCFDKSITSFWEGELSGGGVNGGTLRNAIHKNWYSIFYQWHILESPFSNIMVSQVLNLNAI